MRRYPLRENIVRAKFQMLPMISRGAMSWREKLPLDDRKVQKLIRAMLVQWINTSLIASAFD